MKKRNLLKWFGMFFGVMALMTVVSRAADSVNVARVTVSVMQNQVIVHQVRGSGKVEGTKETAVFAPEQQRVSRILVQEGQQVKEGDLLFVLSEGTILERLKEKREEVLQKKGEVEDLESKAELEKKQRENAIRRAEENYDRAVSNGEINIANAQMEAGVSREKLQIYFDSVAYDPSRRDSSREQALRDEIRSRDEALNQVIMNRDQEVTQAQRALEDARMEPASDNTVTTERKKLKALRAELEELRKLKKSGGEITAPVEGVVKNVSITTGDQTGGEAAIVLYELEGELRMTGSVSENDLEYVGIGDLAELKGSSGASAQDAAVEAIREDGADPQSRIISVAVPEGAFAIGESVEFTISRKAGPYRTCIPLSGVYEDNGKNYVFVTESQDTILGEVLIARKVDVTVVDKNEQTAALGEGSLSADQKVIVGSSRVIENGSRVRLEES